MHQFFIERCVVGDMPLEHEPHSNITLSIRHGGAAFTILYIGGRMLTALPLVLEEYRQAYGTLYHGDPNNLDINEIREARARLRRPFDELMAQLAPNPPPGSPEFLDEYLYPPSYTLEAVVDATGRVRPHCRGPVSRQDAFRRSTGPGQRIGKKYHDNDDPASRRCKWSGGLRAHITPLLSANVNIYPSQKVQILNYRSGASGCEQKPSLVRVDDGATTYFFKPWIQGTFHSYYALEAYHKILADEHAAAPLLGGARICRLHGLVIDKEEDVLGHYPLDPGEETTTPGGDVPQSTEVDEWTSSRLVGLLFVYIENKGTMEDLAPAWSGSPASDEDRARWFGQVHDSVKRLHRAGVVWGDARLDNVLIDARGHAHLVDFWGSYTHVWDTMVDERLRGTQEGDRQALQRMDEELARYSGNPTYLDSSS